MRQREVLLLALLLVAASAPAHALPGPSSGTFLTHGSIVITSNAGFTAANGVTAGTGSPGDPYVISGWSIGGSVGVKVTGTTAAFVIRDNLLDANTGVQISNTASLAVVANNKIILRGTGVLVVDANATIVDNSILGEVGREWTTGILVASGNSNVTGNAIVSAGTAIRVERGSSNVTGNDIHRAVSIGIVTRLSTAVNITANVVTDSGLAIDVRESVMTHVEANVIVAANVGIELWGSKDVLVANNSVRFSFSTQVFIETSSGNVSANIILDGQADAIIVWHSPILFLNNTIENNLGIGIHFAASGATATANVILRNNVGIQMSGADVVHLTANVMLNNTIGISIPYEARQSIHHLQANIVNGVNIDGTINASQRVFFYREANVNISGQVRDAGFSAGFYGAISAQGGVVLYEVDTANINATVISHQRVGVGVVNSFNVNVNASLLVSNIVGVSANATLGLSCSYAYCVDGGPVGIVPNCVVSIKDTNITIPVDPIATIGIDVNGCLAIVGRVNISIVDTGIDVDGYGSIQLFNSTITETKLALNVQGRPWEVNVSGNVIVGNRAGARFYGTQGWVEDNVFLDNDWYGIRMEHGAWLHVHRNNITANGVGIVDAQPCGTGLTCSSVHGGYNVFLANRGDGAKVYGTSWWTGDVALGNAEDGFDVASATIRDVRAAGNRGDGAHVVGTFTVRDSNFSANEGDGLDIRGGGELRDSTFTHNDLAGIRIAATFVTGLHLNVSFNFDGILAAETATSVTGPSSVSVPGLLGAVTALNGGDGGDPFDIHRSTFLGNERDAIRVGSAIVNATHNYWGKTTGPSLSVADQVGAFQNGISPAVRFLPFYSDPAMTTTGPVPGL